MAQVIEYLQQFNYVTITIRLALAVLAGGIIGHERGKHGAAAGLRTHILVCIGSAMTALTGFYIYDTLGLQGDVLRLAAQVVSGIGFLGAGMIIVKNANTITGLTTAAGMWATASIGIALGYGFYSASAIATIFCFVTAAFLSRVERKQKKSVHTYMEVDLANDVDEIVENIKSATNGSVSIEVVEPKSNVPNSIGVYVTVTNIKSATETRKKIKEIKGIRFTIND